MMDQLIGAAVVFVALIIMVFTCLQINKNVPHSVWARRVTYISMWVFLACSMLALWDIGLAVNDL